MSSSDFVLLTATILGCKLKDIQIIVVDYSVLGGNSCYPFGYLFKSILDGHKKIDTAPEK